MVIPKGATNRAERHRLHRERRKRKGEDAARPNSSADISDTDPPEDADIELWEARCKTSSTRFQNATKRKVAGSIPDEVKF
jgi:hypothetical protein